MKEKIKTIVIEESTHEKIFQKSVDMWLDGEIKYADVIKIYNLFNIGKETSFIERLITLTKI